MNSKTSVKNYESNFIDFIFEVDELFEVLKDERIGKLSHSYMKVLVKTLKDMDLSTQTIETYGFMDWQVNNLEELEQVFNWHYHLLKALILKNGL